MMPENSGTEDGAVLSGANPIKAKMGQDEEYGATAGKRNGPAPTRSQGAEPMEFEDIIEDLGSFGHWQRVIFFLICIMDIFGAFAMLSPVFTGATPRWRCANYSSPIGGVITGNVSDADKNFTDDVPALDQCTNPDGAKCELFVYEDDFTSIVSEVRHRPRPTSSISHPLLVR